MLKDQEKKMNYFSKTKYPFFKYYQVSPKVNKIKVKQRKRNSKFLYSFIDSNMK